MGAPNTARWNRISGCSQKLRSVLSSSLLGPAERGPVRHPSAPQTTLLHWLQPPCPSLGSSHLEATLMPLTLRISPLPAALYSQPRPHVPGRCRCLEPAPGPGEPHGRSCHLRCRSPDGGLNEVCIFRRADLKISFEYLEKHGMTLKISLV